MLLIMATALPGTGAPGPDMKFSCDTSDLLMIHNVLRTQFLEMQKLVESATPGDRERAGVIAGHIVGLSHMLHNHHRGEDEILWDRLEQRAPACAVHVEKMKVEHLQVAQLLDKVGDLLPAWRESASAPARDAVAKALAVMNDAFDSHLAQEESEIAPIAAVNMSQGEWNELAEHGRASMPKDKQFIQLGYMFASVTPEQRAALWKTLPPPVRVLYRLVGKRQYQKDRARVYGTAA
jgi:iron-sulfur cluster repair protein YtfE (RIC family)